ncbi:MAG: quinolinate synthase NadA [Planctomycetes bacterium]|nr:quinolinate synthase NadA [Planctomycetota bacterium]
MRWQPPLPECYETLTEDELTSRIAARRRALGRDLLILGHHYQQDDVLRHVDLTGDSLKLSRLAATESRERGTKYIIFCGVHFMAETADILTDQSVAVILPDLSAGCPMADMAEYDDVVQAWQLIHEALRGCWNGRVIPVTYVNSSAAIKAFVGEHGGACCTSTNAQDVFGWALAGGTQPARVDEQIKILFLPDQHLGRNTASKLGFITEVDEAQGLGPSETVVWDPKRPNGGLAAPQIQEADIILWSGYCSVHMHFTPQQIDSARQKFAATGGINIIVHPECRKEVVDQADEVGSTEYIIRHVEQAVPGTNWAVGTEVHLVNRLARRAAARGVNVQMLGERLCLCVMMYRINPPHLLWTLDNLAAGRVVNRITVRPEVKGPARLALQRMLSQSGPPAPRPVPIG